MPLATDSLSTLTPVEIDTRLYALYNEAFDIRLQLQRLSEDAHRQAGDKFDYYNKSWGLPIHEVWAKIEHTASTDGTYIGRNAERLLSEHADAESKLEDNSETQRPLHEEYNRRPWSRAFLVTDGHVHRAMECSTCFETTRFTWLVDLSGKDETEIVALAGERACTVCYPTAPTLRDFEKASPLFTEEEAERAKAREQRAAEKVARNAKKIAAGLTADGSEFVCSWREENGRRWDGATRTYVDGPVEHTERFKTEKAAVQWVVQERSWGQEGPRTAEKRPAFDAIYQAVATKHGKTVDQVITEVDAKVAAKRKRDNRGY
jgi:hypothetical protein